jgi:hypothetical protein
VALVGLAALASSVPTAEETGAPRLRVDQPRIDLGVVIRGQQRGAEFVLRNEGAVPLRILEVESGCACTVVSFDESIPPGGSGKVSASVDTSTLWGEVARRITVRTADPEQDTLHLEIGLVVVGSVRIEPKERLALSNTSRVAPREDRLLIRKDPTEAGELRIQGIETSAPWLEARAERLEAARTFDGGIPPGRPGDWVLTVALSNTTDYRSGLHQVRFRTGLPRQPEIVIPVSVVLRAPVTLSVQRLELAAKGGEARRGTLYAVLRSGLTRDSLEVRPEPPELQVALDPQGERTLRVDVAWTPTAESGVRQGTITFRVGSEEVRLPVGLGPGP